MMRITNSMMSANTKNNINLNKLNEDNINTQMATGQKISRPSDDPVIAIRALRLNTNISQLNQYHDKNIPDANAWLKVTETALSQTDAVFTNIKENLTSGASDTNTADDRLKILENLKGLRNEIYSAGNADYAGRTVFTGYRTGESLTFLATDTDFDASYSIHEELTKDNVDTFKYITHGDKTEETDGEYKELNVKSYDLHRIRLPYDSLKAMTEEELKESIVIPAIDGSEEIKITPELKSIAGMTQVQKDAVYTTFAEDESEDPAAILIPETGEIIMNKAMKLAMDKIDKKNDSNMGASNNRATFDFVKDNWKSGDLRPEHYFACTKTWGSPEETIYFNYAYEIDEDDGSRNYTDPLSQDLMHENQQMDVEVSFNQKVTINTQAYEVYSHDIGRDVEDLLIATEDVIAMDTEIAKLKEELSKATDGSTPSKEDVQKKLDAANKEFSLKRDKMQKMFAKALDKFDGYSEKTNAAIAAAGSMSLRLEITKDRVADQLQSFKELADDNINISLTDTAIDLSNAELALEAAQMAAGKIAKQSLLNYL